MKEHSSLIGLAGRTVLAFLFFIIGLGLIAEARIQVSEMSTLIYWFSILVGIMSMISAVGIFMRKTWIKFFSIFTLVGFSLLLIDLVGYLLQGLRAIT